MLAKDGFRQVAPRYPEKVSIYLPKGARLAIERAAAERGLTPPEMMRRALTEKIIPPKKDC
jgi:hypothetical protein